MSLFRPEQIDPEPTKGRRTDYLYRRVDLGDLGYAGIVRYEPQLEREVEDVRLYIAEHLNRLTQKEASGSYNVMCAWLYRLYRPLDVPLPGD